MKAHGKPKVKRLFKFFFSMCECAVGLGWVGVGLGIYVGQQLALVVFAGRGGRQGHALLIRSWINSVDPYKIYSLRPETAHLPLDLNSFPKNDNLQNQHLWDKSTKHSVLDFKLFSLNTNQGSDSCPGYASFVNGIGSPMSALLTAQEYSYLIDND